MMAYPIFVFSLDVELCCVYGLYPRHKRINVLLRNEKDSRGPTDALLDIFDKHNIPATWAIVGHLFLDHCEREGGIPHKHMPRFRDDWYWWDPCTNIGRDPLFYGKDIVEKILSSQVKHEIGYHSFSHVPFSECSREVAEMEIQEGIKLARELGISLKSFVFPENKIGHTDVLEQYGFRAYRGPNLAGKNLNKNLPQRALNFAVSKIIAPAVMPIWRRGIWEIPSSMIFSDGLFPFTLELRARMGLRKAIRDNKVFHIFLHPEDLLAAPSLSNKLDRFLAFVSQKREEGKLQVMTMGELSMTTPDRKEGSTR